MNRRMGFAAGLAPLIMTGLITYTYRIGSKYADVNPGEVIDAYDSDTSRTIATIRVRYTYTSPFGALWRSRPGSEIYETHEHMQAVFESYYPEMNIAPWTIVHVIRFDLYRPDGVTPDAVPDLNSWRPADPATAQPPTTEQPRGLAAARAPARP
jgi:uncharacterized protein YqfB (UPF0267 family)